jgi:hypothetical protein
MPLRFELFNTTLWCADSFETAQPLIKTALGNTYTKRPLQAFGPKITNSRGFATNHTAAMPPSGEKVHAPEKGWNAPQWFVPVVVSTTATSSVLLVLVCLCLYRWHLHRNPPVVTMKPVAAASAGGPVSSSEAGQLRSPASSQPPSTAGDSQEEINGAFLTTKRQHSGAIRKPRAGVTLNRTGLESSSTSSGLSSRERPPSVSATTNTKTRLLESLSHVAMSNSMGGITGWYQDAATTSGESAKIPRGSAAGRGTGSTNKGSEASSKGAHGVARGSTGSSSTEHVALDMVRAEVHAAVRQMQVCTSSTLMFA